MRFQLTVFFGVALSVSFCTQSFAHTNEISHLQKVEDLSKAALISPSDPKWNPAPSSLPLGAELTVLEGDPEQPGPFLIRLKLPADYQIPAHWNFSDEHITVISGTLNLGLGDKLDTHKSKALPAGSFARIPAKIHHYSWCSEDTVIQLHGIGPWGIQYLNSGDNPHRVDMPDLEEGGKLK